MSVRGVWCNGRCIAVVIEFIGWWRVVYDETDPWVSKVLYNVGRDAGLETTLVSLDLQYVSLAATREAPSNSVPAPQGDWRARPCAPEKLEQHSL